MATTALMLTAITSCKKERFDKDAYDKYVGYEFMIDNVDKTHEWNLTKEGTVTLKSKEKMYTVQILTENPYSSDNAEIAAEANLSPGSEVTLSYTIPNIQNQLYAAALNSNGAYMGVYPFTYGTEYIDFNNVSLTRSGTAKTPSPQQFTYCFEEDFPEPGDFDYNDIVLRIAKEKGNASYQIRLTVTLQAVGSRKQLAGAINLAGVQYDDLYSVKMEEEEIMDADYPIQHIMLTDAGPLVKGRNGEAIIYLFDDAHWAMVKDVDEDGSLLHPYVNTQNPLADDFRNSRTITPLVRHYVITFKNIEQARAFTFAKLDPFILEEYNGGVWEVHTHPYKFNDVVMNIFRGNQSAYDNHIAWAIAVPKADFHYPQEGMPIGTFTNNTDFGAFYTRNHSFSEWMRDQNAANDWYLYPNLTYNY